MNASILSAARFGLGAVTLEQVRKRDRPERQGFVMDEVPAVVVDEIGRAAAHLHNQLGMSIDYDALTR